MVELPSAVTVRLESLWLQLVQSERLSGAPVSSQSDRTGPGESRDLYLVHLNCLDLFVIYYSEVLDTLMKVILSHPIVCLTFFGLTF